MSQYSEMMGSFVRTGDYPLEANYIFTNVEALKEFYNDPVNKTTLHEGLLRLVIDDDGVLSLYWVKRSNDLLVFEKLIASEDITNLYLKIVTESDNVKDELKDFENRLENFETLSDDIQNCKDNQEDLNNLVKIIIGTDQDNIEEYLKSLPYESLTELSEELHKFLHTPEDYHGIKTLSLLIEYLHHLDIKFDSVKNNIQDELNITLQSIGLDGSGNYTPDQSTNFLGNTVSIMHALKELDFKVNLALLGGGAGSLSGIMKDAKYNSNTEEIVLVFNLEDDLELEIKIPVKDIIEEYVVDNSKSNVNLSITRSIEGKSTISANVEEMPNVISEDVIDIQEVSTITLEELKRNLFADHWKALFDDGDYNMSTGMFIKGDNSNISYEQALLIFYLSIR